MVDFNVSEHHMTTTNDGIIAGIEIVVEVVGVPYQKVRAIEAKIFEFVQELRTVGGVPLTTSCFPYTDEEKAIVHTSTRENVWERYHEAFPTSKRTRDGILTYFRGWKRSQKTAGVPAVTTDAPAAPAAATPIAPADQSPSKKTLAIPKLNKWQMNFLTANGVSSHALLLFHKKWPGLEIADVDLVDIHSKIPVAKEEPAVGADEGVTKDRFKPKDRVIQSSGFCPAPGIGIVQAVRGDGVMTVKFSNSTKVLHMDNFVLAPE